MIGGPVVQPNKDTRRLIPTLASGDVHFKRRWSSVTIANKVDQYKVE